MKNLPLGIVCSAAIALGQARPSAAPAASEDVPVPGGTAMLASALAIEPVPDRARFMFEVTRLAYDADARNPAAAAYLQALRLRTSVDPGDGAANDLVPVPLTAEVWSSAIFRRRVQAPGLVTAIVADRPASLLCHGLAALDDETLEFLAAHAGVLTRLYERSAAAFAAFSDSVHVHDGRVVPPGGAEAVPLWEAVVGEKTARPERFVPALFEASDGRIASVYDVTGRLDPARRAFVLGASLSPANTRLDRFRDLMSAVMSSFGDWHIRSTPFGRASWDLAMTLTRLDVTPSGVPAAPASRAFWSQVFGSTDLTENATAPDLSGQPFDAAWLVGEVGMADVRQRAERLDQLALAQRAFGTMAAGDAGHALVALRAVPHYRMLMLTLDRIGIRSPAVYAAAARHAHRLDSFEANRGFVAQAQFQGALAVIARMVAVRTIDPSQAEALVASLAALPLREDGRYSGAIARWLRDHALGGATTGAEAALIAALGGAPSAAARPVRVVWEGQPYRLDLGFAERHRLEQVRGKQGGVSLDLPFELISLADALQAGTMAGAQAAASAVRLTAIASEAPRRLRDEGGWLPPGIGEGTDAREVLRRAADDLQRLGRSRDTKREMRMAEPLVDLADEWLGQVLLSFTYAIHVGDPEGTVLLAGDVSARHDFGFASKDASVRARSAWAMPRQDVSPGAPWHVSGSLLGLDVALAPLTLRRLNFDHLTRAPKLTSNERDSFAASVSLMNPYALRDADRDAIADAAARGRARIAAVGGDPTALGAVADELVLDGGRRRAIAWTAAHDAERLASFFTLTELVWLGKIDERSLDAWGMFALPMTGCLCTRVTPPGSWWLVVGRPQIGMMASAIADLHLHVAIRLAELQLPAPLAKEVLSAAMQDLIDEVRPTDNSDWLSVARAAIAATREQIEDYLAAATADGPLVPDDARSTP